MYGTLMLLVAAATDLAPRGSHGSVTRGIENPRGCSPTMPCTRCTSRGGHNWPPMAGGIPGLALQGGHNWQTLSGITPVTTDSGCFEKATQKPALEPKMATIVYGDISIIYVCNYTCTWDVPACPVSPGEKSAHVVFLPGRTEHMFHFSRGENLVLRISH
jgi:hypothetical protein